MHTDKHIVVGSMARIAALQGAESRTIQHVMGRCAKRWAAQGARVVGLVETPEPAASGSRRTGQLESLGTGEIFPLFQDLGMLASACRLDAASLVKACATLCAEIRRGCDLVVLNKFGKLEACRSGLTEAFALAAERDIPILTAVSPVYQAAWDAFSAPLGLVLPPEDLVLDGWWHAVRGEASRLDGVSPARP